MIHHSRASSFDCSTPSPFTYKIPKLVCAVACPCLAAGVYSSTAFSIFAVLIPPLLALFLRRLLPSISYILFDVLLVSNVLLGNHGRNIAPCGIICRGAMGATVFWVCRKWSSRESWEWFVLLVYLTFEDTEELPRYLELLL